MVYVVGYVGVFLSGRLVMSYMLNCILDFFDDVCSIKMASCLYALSGWLWYGVVDVVCGTKG